MKFDENVLREASERLASALRVDGPITEDSLLGALDKLIDGAEKEKNKNLFSEEYLSALDSSLDDVSVITHAISKLNEIATLFAVCPVPEVREVTVSPLYSIISNLAYRLESIAEHSGKEIYNLDPHNIDKQAL